MPNPVFIRALWGSQEYWSDKSLYRRSAEKLRTDIRNAVKWQAGINAVNYVWGRENAEFLKSLGFDCRLISEQGIVWAKAGTGAAYRHKLESWRLAANEFGEFVFLDWDMVQQKPIPADFWDRLRQKHELQLNLMLYARRRAKDWRIVDARKMPSAAFCYCRNPQHIDGIIKVWETKPDYAPGSWFEEIAIAYYIDMLHGGWPGVEKWFEWHEPYCCAPCKPALPPELVAKKTEHIFSYFP